MKDQNNNKSNPLKAPFTDVRIKTQQHGFCRGFSTPIALIRRLSVCLLVVWAAVRPAIANNVAGYSKESVTTAYRYTFLHNGFHAWSIYVVTAISMAYYSYTRDMPSRL